MNTKNLKARLGRDVPDNSVRKIIQRPIGSLKPSPNNSRTHTPKEIRQIGDSIRRFGFTNPILIDRSGNVLAGHARLAAAGLLVLKSVPTIRLEDLTEAERRAYLIADNKLAQTEQGGTALSLPRNSLRLPNSTQSLTSSKPALKSTILTSSWMPVQVPGESLKTMHRPSPAALLSAAQAISGSSASINSIAGMRRSGPLMWPSWARVARAWCSRIHHIMFRSVAMSAVLGSTNIKSSCRLPVSLAKGSSSAS
jgi:hypothetical protein